jgi:galactokinase
VVVVVKTDVKQIDVHAERLDKCAIVQILLVKINECIYHACKVKYGEMSISVIKSHVQCCYILNMNERLKLVSDTQYMLHSLCFQCQKPHRLFQ